MSNTSEVGLPKIGDEVHYVPAFGECRPAIVTELGGVLTLTTRNAAGQVCLEESCFTDEVVRLNDGGVTRSEVPRYWAEDGETALANSWHWAAQCRATPAEGGIWPTMVVP